jgi:hypothetical protein
MFLYPLYPYLKAKLEVGDQAPVPRQGAGTSGSARGGYADNMVTTPHGHVVRLTSKDV